MTYATVADLARPSDRTRAIAYDVAAVLAGSLLMALCAQIAFRLPFAPLVPVTMQTFGVLVLGMLLGPARGTAAVVAYLAEGLIGLPVFAQGALGAAYMAGPTGGYLVAFVPAVWLVGTLARRGWDRSVARTLLAMALGTAVIFAGGWAWLVCLTGSATVAFAGGVVPFLPGAVVKV
ncbi:MAG: biotin transporter BioY, partial [Phycisphaerae bacterium]